MQTIQSRPKVGLFAVLTVFAWLATATWAPSANATSTLYDNNCSGCHGSTSGVAPYPVSTCAGCHAHGVHSSSAKNDINVTATPDSATYNAGDPITVSVTGSYRSGWVRAQMWDLDCSAAGTCNQGNALVSESLYTSGNTVNFPGPVILNATAPATPGVYTWSAGWYGNEFDTNNGAFGLWIPDSTNSGHGNELVTFSFEVVGTTNTPPEAVNDTESTPANTPVDLDLVANDNDADGDTLFVNADYDTSSVNGGTIGCNTGVTTPTPQCTYAPALDFCGNDSFTYRAFDGTDPSANRATVSIQVGDSEPPVVSAPTPDLLIILPAGTDPGTAVPATNPEIAAWLASASADDTQDGAVPVENNAPANFPVGTTTVTFTATDVCGNVGSAQADVVIQIEDNSIPVVSAPAPLAVTAALCATTVPQTDAAIADWLASATADDLEEGPLPVDNDAPVDFPLGDTLVTFSATDSLGATGTDTSTLTVNETPNTAPVVTVPAPPLDITVPNGTTSVPATDPTIAAWLDSASAEDLEDGLLTVTNDAPADFSLGTTTVTFSATDSCGLTTTATSTVTITEEAPAVNNPPELTVPADLTVEGALCATSIPETDPTIADWLASATASDAEDGDLTSSITNDAPANFPASMAPGTATTVTFSVTDSGDPTGNPATTTATSTLTALDPNTAPTVTAPAPLSITVPAGTTSVPATDPVIAGWLASASASDAEDGGLNVTDNAPADFPLGTTTVTFTATDACGVSDTAVSTVTIIEEAVADVWVSKLKVPNKVNGKVGRTVTKSISVRADGDTITQDATVTLSVMSAPANVTVVVDPASITDVVEPGKPLTQFRWFEASITCNEAGNGTVSWEASIDALENGDGSNDILTGTSVVTCR